MSYTALYRKFRPASFEEVKGQDAIVTTLRNQIMSGRTGHAYLFCGTRGTGKTSVAKLFARAVNCEHRNGADPCGECESCRAALNSSSVNIIEIDAASNNSVDDVRSIREEVAYRPAGGRYKVYIIDEAHMLSTGAFNALLKTLEEPPDYVIFILATTEAAKLPVTIVSRCQRYDFRRISIDMIAARINELLAAEGLAADEKGIRYISRLADGSMRDALSLLERCVSGCTTGKISYDDILDTLGTVDSEGFSSMLDAIRKKDIMGAVRQLEEYSVSGKDMSSFASDFTWYLRNLMLAGSTDGLEDMLDVTTEEYQELKARAAGIPDEELIRYIRVFSALCGRLRNSVSKRVDVEMTLIRLCRPEMDTDTDALKARINSLEAELEEFKASIPRYVSAAQEVQPVPERKPEKKAPVRKAAPAGLMKVRKQWDKITSGQNGLIGSMLEGSEPMYDASGESNILYISVRNETVRDYLKEAADCSALYDAIQTAAEGTVEVAFVARSDAAGSDRLSEIQIIDNIKKLIDADIEIYD